MSDTLDFDLPKHRSSVIKVIGVGGGGSNAVNYMKMQGIRGVDFIVCNTDAQALAHSPVETKIQLGADLTEGLGAGANPDVGEQAALESYGLVQAALQSQTKMVFITAGMGGGTGTGAAPIIAKAAREMGILTIGIVTAPFAFEGGMRQRQAEAGVAKLKEHVDSLIVINNNKLREVYGNLGFKAGFNKADEVLATAAKGIAEVITHHYNVNIDLHDARTVLRNSGTAIMGSAKATGPNRAMEAVQEALDSPLLNDNHIQGAKHVLLLIVSGTGQREITFDEIGEINDHIQDQAGRQVDIIMGIGEDEQLGEAIQVTVIATGFSANNPVGTLAPSVPETVVYDLEEDKPLNQVPKMPEPKAASAQIDLFQAIEDQPLPEDPKKASRGIPSPTSPAEQPLAAHDHEDDASAVVHQLEELSSPEASEASAPIEDALPSSEGLSTLGALSPWDQPIESEFSAPNIEGEENLPMGEAFDNTAEESAYDMPAFDMSADVEWDIEQPLHAAEQKEERAFDSESTAYRLEDESEGFALEGVDSFDAFSHDAPINEFIPEVPMPVAPSLEVEDLFPAVDYELHDAAESTLYKEVYAPSETMTESVSEEPFMENSEAALSDQEERSSLEENVPNEANEAIAPRREVASYNLEDLRALEAELNGTAAPTIAESQRVESSDATSEVLSEQEDAFEAVQDAIATSNPSVTEDWAVSEVQVPSSSPFLDPEAALPKQGVAYDAKDTAEKAAKEEGFELKVVSNVPKGPAHLDPEHDPISREQLARVAAERRAYLQNYNHSFQGHVQAMVLDEQDWETPSYERKGMDVTPIAHSKESNLGQTGISGDNKDIEFRSHNSFLHDNVD
ncbi:MAG: cell division protein FtsZ [Cryomorphaceae bacterium]|nr:cell division protein FtsZ [Cryomorphaceae bacterium]